MFERERESPATSKKQHAKGLHAHYLPGSHDTVSLWYILSSHVLIKYIISIFSGLRLYFNLSLFVFLIICIKCIISIFLGFRFLMVSLSFIDCPYNIPQLFAEGK